MNLIRIGIDVYKRQAISRLCTGEWSFKLQRSRRNSRAIFKDEVIAVAGIIPVSYTHLDVYKRQAVARVVQLQHQAAVARDIAAGNCALRCAVECKACL